MDYPADKRCWLGLKLSPDLRNRLYVYVNKAGGPEALWSMPKTALIDIGLKESAAESFIAFRESLDIDMELGRMIDAGVDLITDKDSDYPNQLRESPWHPGALFVKGKPRQFDTGIAIVGSRRATAYGKNMAEELARDLSEAGIVIVSGGARGIDSSAHKSTLEAGGTTYAIFGCGLNQSYPPENRMLFEQIAIHGALISEYPLDTPPLAHHFPARNRIVAGMCQAVVVVEAGQKSGALITADFALEFGRDVFAVPGYSKSEMSKGSNRLIKQGACLIENADDILEALGFDLGSGEAGTRLQAMTAAEQEFLSLIGWETKSMDEIMHETGSSITNASIMLITLEISGFIKKDIAGSYMRIK